MAAIEQRRDSRRKGERREGDRRLISYAFGSPEWLENIKKNHLVWPKTDRRKSERRVGERRTHDRRDSNMAQIRSRTPEDILSKEERKVLHEMFNG